MEFLWSSSFLEEISRPLRPTRVLRSRAEVQFQLHPDLEGFKPRCSNDARQPNFFRHLYDSYRIRGHMIKQCRGHVHNSIRDQFSLRSELSPLHPRGMALTADSPRRDHEVSTFHASDRHQLAQAAELVEFFDRWWWMELAHILLVAP